MMKSVIMCALYEMTCYSDDKINCDGMDGSSGTHASDYKRMPNFVPNTSKKETTWGT